MQHWVEHDLPQAYECFDQKQKARTSIHKIVPIKLGDLVSAFLILGIGTGFGLFIFLIEHIANYYRNQSCSFKIDKN